jgi:molybdopterin-guanine dinucleotide biosynthesis protein A
MKSRVEICILAGGLGSRMGRDKSTLRLGGRTLLARIRETAKSANFSTRIIRRDLVPRCGPLGGIYTALKTTSANAVLFLACDMPNVSGALLRKIIKHSENGREPVFTWHNNAAGFPLLLNVDALPVIEKVLAEKQFALQTLFEKVRAKKFRPNRSFQSDLLNINTPKDWARLRGNFAMLSVNARSRKTA